MGGSRLMKKIWLGFKLGHIIGLVGYGHRNWTELFFSRKNFHESVSISNGRPQWQRCDGSAALLTTHSAMSKVLKSVIPYAETNKSHACMCSPAYHCAPPPCVIVHVSAPHYRRLQTQWTCTQLQFKMQAAHHAY